MRQNRQYVFNMSYLEVFGVLIGVGVDVSKIFGVGAGAGVSKCGAGAESESEKCDSAHLCFKWLLKAGSEISNKEGSMDSHISGTRCFRDLVPLTVEAICQMYPPRVVAHVAWEWAWLTGVNNWSKLTGILPQCNLCMNLPISRMYISPILSRFNFLYNGETLHL